MVGSAALSPLQMRERELVERLRWFIRLRWLAATGVIVSLYVARFGLGISARAVPTLMIAAIIYFYNILFILVDRHLRRDGRMPLARELYLFANVQVILDLLALSFLLHYLGGAKTCFIVFYFFHMIIASILLSTVNSYLLAAFAALLIYLLIWGRYLGWLTPYDLGPNLDAVPTLQFCLKRSSVITFALFMSVYFASSIARRLRQRERQLEGAFAQLQRAEEQKSFFMRRASHELRSPLSAIQSFVQIFLKGMGGDLSEKQRGMLLRMQARLEGMLAMVDDLLRLSRLRDADAETGERCLVDLSETVRKVGDLMQAWAEERGVTVSIQTEVCQVKGNSDELQQIISNLLSNAIKYTPSGGSVDVTLNKQDDRVHFSVADTGIGMKPEEKQHLFEEFFRSLEAKRMTESGTGLGLSITRKIVEIHGGKIECESESGKGTRFDVWLPSAGQEEITQT